MPILYYPISAMKKPLNPVEKLQRRDVFYTQERHQDLAASGLSYTFGAPFANWSVRQVTMHFSNANMKDFYVKRAMGRGIISKLNDLLRISANGVVSQEIYLSPGFYTGTTLATEIKSKLDANALFIANGNAPFTVVYGTATGLFTIASAAGTIQFFIEDTTVGVRRDSNAGPGIGFTVDSSNSASIASDTPVFGLNNDVIVESATGDSTIDVVVMPENAWNMDVDSALKIDISTVATLVDIKVIYQEVV